MSGGVASADELMRWAASAAVPADEALLTPFGFVDVPALSQAGRVDALVALERLRSWVDAMQARVFAACAAADDSPEQWGREEIAAALHLSRPAVDERLHAGRELVERLPEALGLLQDGTLTVRHTRPLVEAVLPLDDATTAAVQTRVLDRVREQVAVGGGAPTPAAFGRAVRRAVVSTDPRTAEVRHRQAATQRRVVITAQPDGMAELWALLPADGAATIFTALTAAAARRVEGDERSVDQRRADALVTLAAQTLDNPGLPRWQGRRPRVQVTVAATTLLGLDDEPGHLESHGPIPASLARRIAADPSGTWRRLLTDEAGVLLDSSRTYRPPVELAEFVRARDRRCRFPGCSQPARRCELDHQQSWESGGRTEAGNLECLCLRHHQLKHRTGWHVAGDPAEVLSWTSPTGHVYLSFPDPYD